MPSVVLRLDVSESRRRPSPFGHLDDFPVPDVVLGDIVVDVPLRGPPLRVRSNRVSRPLGRYFDSVDFTGNGHVVGVEVLVEPTLFEPVAVVVLVANAETLLEGLGCVPE